MLARSNRRLLHAVEEERGKVPCRVLVLLMLIVMWW
jgi:hypothetical protein